MSDTPPPVPPSTPDAIVPPQPNPYAQPVAQPNPYAQPVAQPNPYAQPAPYGAPGAYGAPGYTYGPRMNTLAIVGFVLAFVVSVAGIVCSHLALNQIKRTGEGGHGLALAGLIISYVITGLWVLYFAAAIVVVIVSTMNGSAYSNF